MAAAVAVALLLLITIWLVPWLMTLRSGLSASEHFKAMADIRTGVIAAFVMLGGGGSLWYTQKTFRMSQSANLTGHFESAAKQIGTMDVTVRIAGLYAMAQLADGWREKRQACIDVLCAYLRANDQSASAALANSAALALISRHLHSDRVVSWIGYDFDLTGINMKDADFSEVMFTDGRFSFDGATFGGTVTFDNARFTADSVSFRKAVFARNCCVTFNAAEFDSGSVNFDGIKLEGGQLSFDNASFSDCHVTFSGARLGDKGDLSMKTATVRKLAKNSTAQKPHLDFTGAKFLGEGSVSFEGTTFIAPVSFDGAEFRRDVSFKETKLKGTELSFRRSQFVSGTLSFADASNEGSALVFDEGTDSSGGQIDVTGIRHNPLKFRGVTPLHLIRRS